ncbi:hypothetical protein RJ55_03392 [Drechmeria coniospora]|nr:hypothetical protein RJ55_03392 [Drechmeria coniospora]
MMAASGVVPPVGTFQPGTKIQVGSHRVVIQKYLSEGGFAHVYVVKLSSAVDGTDIAVLKRVAVPDKEALRSMRIEVETMKRLKGHRPIVTYIDSHASELKGSGYEVFLLMEYCNGGGLIDFMNTRLKHRLTEPEILDIFADVAEGVACMHYLDPPLLHRDLKVENVLITARGSAKRFKLCDFGSASPPRPAPSSVVECRLMDEDVQKHTTLQYRSPEMIDVYRKQPLNEKSDIWALGVLLYKLCYYTTPFEDQGQLAILNASFKYPSLPVFSDRIKKLIASMLRENMEERPTVYQVLKDACAMQGRQVPIQDKYARPSRTETRASESAKPSEPRTQTPTVGAVFAPPVQEKQAIPDVVPMRRGRPTPSPGPTTSSSPRKVTKGDPFAALDSNLSHKANADELSSRFPTLDQFALLHDRGGKFDFESTTSPPLVPPKDSGQIMAEKLADATFASSLHNSTKSTPTPASHPVPSSMPQQDVIVPAEGTVASNASPTRRRAEQTRLQSTISTTPDPMSVLPPASRYVSTGTMTSDVSPKPLPRQAALVAGKYDEANRFPPAQPRPSHFRQPSLSSRPSIEDLRNKDPGIETVARSQSLVIRPRPASTSFESSTLEFLRKQESARALNKASHATARKAQHKSSSSVSPATLSDVDMQPSNATGLLVDLDDAPAAESYSNGRGKQSNISGGARKLTGKFGDAFQRFEENTPAMDTASPRAPSPVKAAAGRGLTPIAGSEATDGRSDDGLVDLTHDMTPEMRRELERRTLEEEEQRVAAAQAEYRDGLAGGSRASRPVPGPKKMGGAAIASTIQSRVQSLLDEDQKSTKVQRTAEGYGRYSDDATAASKPEKKSPTIPRKPLGISKAKVDVPVQSSGALFSQKGHAPSATLVQASVSLSKATGSRPAAPKKPIHLNRLPAAVRPPSPVKSSQPSQPERLMAADLPGKPIIEMSPQEKDDYIREFTKRFPSLGSMDLEPGGSGGGGAARR